MTFKQAQLCSGKIHLIKIHESKGLLDGMFLFVRKESFWKLRFCHSGAHRDMYFGWKPLLHVFWPKAPDLMWAQTPVVNKCMINIWYVVSSKAVYFSVKSSIVWYVNMRQMPNAHSELYPISIAWYVFGMNAVPFSTLDKGNPKANCLLHKCQSCFSQISWEVSLPLIMHGCLWCPQ